MRRFAGRQEIHAWNTGQNELVLHTKPCFFHAGWREAGMFHREFELIAVLNCRIGSPGR